MAWGDVAAPITAMGRAAAATLAFRMGGELRVAVVVKATFVLAPDAPMVRADPEPILRADQPRDKSPSSSLVASSDLVPYRPRADVLLYGHARAPRDAPTPAMGVRLMVARGQDVVLDKRLAVRGTQDPSGRTREPTPFAAMLLAWELAAAGPDNPVGIKEGSGRAWPHIVDPRRLHQPAGFGPLSPRWPARGRLLPAGDRAFAAPIPELPRDFAWAYFNAAPEDQRLDFFRGDEWIGFEGMNSQLPRVQSCLPGVSGGARVYGPTAQLLCGQPLHLEADTLTIDTDRLRCSVVWRGSFPVATDREIAALQIFAGVETAAERLSFPSAYTGRAPQRPPTGSSPARPPHSEEADSSTAVFDVPAFSSSAPAIPFGPSSSAPRRPPSQQLPAATPFERARLVPPPAPDAQDATADLSTLTGDDDLLGGLQTTLAVDARIPPNLGPALPFTPGPAPPAVTRSGPRPPNPDAGGTMDVSALVASAGLPFNAAPPAGSAPRPPTTPPGSSRPPAPQAAPPPSPFDGNATMDVRALLSGQALPFGAAARSEARPPPRSAPPPAPAPNLGATMDVSALLSGQALPFGAAPRSEAHPPPRSTPPPAPAPTAGATMDVSALLAAQTLPFGPPPSAPPAPLPFAPRGPLFPEVARPAVAAIPPTPVGAAPAQPVRMDVPLPAPEVPEGETPKTLGGFFLAAMARAGRTGAQPAARAP